MKLAYCGDRCEFCPRYLATLSNDKDELKRVAILMKQAGWPHDFTNLDNNKCTGCEDINNCEYGLKECCTEMEVQNCGECPQYPCEKVKRAFEITDENAITFKNKFTKKEYETFNKAFFMKKKYLDEIALKTRRNIPSN